MQYLKLSFSQSYTNTNLASVSSPASAAEGANIVEGLGRLIGVKPIYTSKEDLEALKNVIESRNMSEWAKDNQVKKIVGARCCICGGISTQIASYDYIGATRIERYCDACVEKQFARSTNTKSE